MKKSHGGLNIEVGIKDDPAFGLSVAFNFSKKIRSFGLTDEKAEIFAVSILKNVQEIRRLAAERAKR